MSNLLLARTVQRRREIAVRTALGARPWRIVRQVFAECLVLAAAAAALGLLLAPLSLRAIGLLLQWERWDAATAAALAAGIDWRMLLYTFLVTLASVALFGLTPALSATRVSLMDAFQSSQGNTAEGRRARFGRQLLVAGQVALAVVLLSGAGLLVRSFVQLQRVERGYDAHQLLTMRLPMPRARPAMTPQSRSAVFATLVERIEAMPGVASAAVVTGLPLGGLNARVTINVEGHAVLRPQDMPTTHIATISPGYFETMRTRLLRGRAFSDMDTAQGQPVAIVNDALVRRYWPDRDPIGRRIGPGRDSLVVVGVVENLRQESLQTTQEPTLYIPHAQRTSLAASPQFLAVRTAAPTEPAAIASAVRAEIRAMDGGQVVRDVRTMEEVLARSVSQERGLMALVTLFGLLALFLACAGVYSASHYLVVQRTRELGIRASLGARPGAILALVVGQGMRPVLIGITLGLALAIAGSRTIATFLFDVSPLDPLTFAAVPCLAAAVALLALWVPARMATRIDPVIALRRE